MANIKVLQDPVSVMGRVERTVRTDAQTLGLNVSEILREALTQAVEDAISGQERRACYKSSWLKTMKLWKIPSWK